MSDRLDRAGVAALALSAAYFAIGVLWVRAHHESGLPASDIYGYVYPASVYAWRALRDGVGLLWNPYQDCGQPFFAVSQTGLLYPVNWLFFIVGREPALIGSAFVNLTIAGIGAYRLGRAIGLGVAAALCGALAFQLGGSTVLLVAWTPIHIATYAWLPVALWRTERLLHGASVRRGIWLGLALTVQLLPGFPQIVFFTYQLIALRIGWGLLLRESPRPLAVIASAALGLALPPFLAAVQLVPALEVARASLRSLPLPAIDVGPGFSRKILLDTLAAYGFYPGDFLVVVLAVLALIATPAGARRRQAVYYALIAVGYLILSVGPGTPLFALYERLPLGNVFRGSARLLWVTGFAMAMLAGIGAEAFLTPARTTRVWIAAGVSLLFAALVYAYAPNGLRVSDAIMAVLVLGAALGPPEWRGALPMRMAAAAIVVVVAANGIVFSASPLSNLRTGDVYGRAASAFEFVRARMTPQDRALIVGRYGATPDFSLTQKSASLFRVPAIFDYEPQASRSYAEFFTTMRTGHTLQSLNDWYWVFDKLLPPTLQRPLFDLTAARFILVDETIDQTLRVLTPGARLLTQAGYVRIYENEQALPRARYVPRVTVVPAEQVLSTLVGGTLDARRVAVVSEAPQSGFLGSPGDTDGVADIVDNGAERVAVRVHAPAPGFLFLADQFFPGWTATVNGVEAEIIRADHTFRLVEVPAGESDVVFTYRPASMRIGMLISLLTCVALAILLRATRVRR